MKGVKLRRVIRPGLGNKTRGRISQNSAVSIVKGSELFLPSICFENSKLLCFKLLLVSKGSLVLWKFKVNKEINWKRRGKSAVIENFEKKYSQCSTATTAAIKTSEWKFQICRKVLNNWPFITGPQHIRCHSHRLSNRTNGKSTICLGKVPAKALRQWCCLMG